MPFTNPSDKHIRSAAGKGHQKSLTAQARFCTEPVTLPRAPWEKPQEEATNEPQN